MEMTKSLISVLEMVNEGIHVVDENGITVVYNQAASKIDGLSKEEVVGKHILRVFPSLDDDSSTLLKVLRSGISEKEKQQTFVNFKGRKITTINSSHPIMIDGDICGACEISTDITRVKDMAENLLDLRRELRSMSVSQKKSPPDSRLFTLNEIVGESAVIRKIKDIVLKVAATQSSVMVWGETGTGKELLVQAIHSASRRSNNPFVPQNCAALPESLLEGLVFGTSKGGFTGAQDRPGLLELASEGTLYLDEIDSMPLGLQAKLLRVLQDKRVRRLGDVRERPIDVRFISSTSVPPREAIKAGVLRADLYYRLSVVEIGLPPLRERKEDIPHLCGYFLSKYRYEGSVGRVSSQVMNTFMTYEWPGNIRELEHAIEGSLPFAKGGVIECEDLPQSVKGISVTSQLSRHTVPLRKEINNREKQMIESALTQGKSVSGAARLLGIPRQTLQYRIKKLGIRRD